MIRFQDQASRTLILKHGLDPSILYGEEPNYSDIEDDELWFEEMEQDRLCEQLENDFHDQNDRL